MKMTVVKSSETSIPIYQIIRLHIPGDSILHVLSISNLTNVKLRVSHYCFSHFRRSRNGSVGIVTGWRAGVRFPAGARIFFSSP
jgi:hypothetical protein